MTSIENFPATRYQGSKLKVLGWLWEQLRPLEFDSVVDLFGGTGSVSYLFKVHGKQVHYNDCLRSNHLIGKALIENPSTRLAPEDVVSLLVRRKRTYEDFIARTFGGIYYPDEENQLLDVVAQNLAELTEDYRQALAYHAVFQACIAKRPYNLFHRANLYMREATVERSFGNKATWDRPFADHVAKQAAVASDAVFDNGRANLATCADAALLEGRADLAYLDPPYVSAKGVGVDYLGFYHFLEGLTEYRDWPKRFDDRYKHKPYRRVETPWTQPARIASAFEAVFERWKDSILVVSYRSDGVPSIEELKRLLQRHKRRVTVRERDYQYALSTNQTSREVLLIAE
ncbi:DNA adenine methylase [Myxococcus sp. AM011]|uniref:DNA adenine methylase n=1 Tax=Myxococcus sp. AM011 TaxID=2745200 RepID=UPI0015959887|nr:DNA adenine methylase [Myxococcus sp. AM011]NVJ22272.1 DNA adenine methylase [Myxococcus sp. AM011]